MQRDARCYLWDALKAAEAVQTFLRGETYEAFVEDDLQVRLEPAARSLPLRAGCDRTSPPGLGVREKRVA
jgi:hypothetical protein